MSDGIARSHAIAVATFLADVADAEGIVTGWTQRAAATAAGLTYYQFRDGLQRLAILGAARMLRSGNATHPPIYRTLATLPEVLARIGAPAEPTGGPDASAAARTIADRRACDRLLARLLKFHGRNPPDADAAAAVSRLRATLREQHA